MTEVGNGGMTDDEYKAHFAMWAGLNSPLLMGNDLRTMTASAYSILNNPAIIAINQDPFAKPMIRVLRNQTVPKDKYGQGETQVWAGKLWGGDRVVILLNAADEDMEMSATLEEIFIQETGKAPQVEQDWQLFDLWANRMSEDDAQRILDSPSDTSKVYRDLDWYNSTEVSYAEGVKAGDKRLLGKKIGIVKARGKVSAKVKRHSAEVYRLRSTKIGEAGQPRDEIDAERSIDRVEL